MQVILYTNDYIQVKQHNISACTNAGYITRVTIQANCKQHNNYIPNTRVTSQYAYRLQGLQVNCKQHNVLCMLVTSELQATQYMHI